MNIKKIHNDWLYMFIIQNRERLNTARIWDVHLYHRIADIYYYLYHYLYICRRDLIL